VLIESPRREIMKLMNWSSSEARRRSALRDSRHSDGLCAGGPYSELQPVAARARFARYKTDEPLFLEGDEASTLALDP